LRLSELQRKRALATGRYQVVQRVTGHRSLATFAFAAVAVIGRQLLRNRSNSQLALTKSKDLEL
jgi:hypothetical protein